MGPWLAMQHTIKTLGLGFQGNTANTLEKNETKPQQRAQ